MKLLTTTALAGLAVMALASPTVNGVKISPRVYNDMTGTTFTSTNNFNSTGQIIFDEQNLTGSGSNRHTWALSSDGGATAAIFHPDDFFSLSWTLVLTGMPISPRKEAGFLIDDLGSGIGQSYYIVNTDGHETVAFGGPFYAFPANYQSGTAINMEFDYFKGSDGRRKVQYFANGVGSGILDITNNENSLFATSGGTVDGYMQDNGATGGGSSNANWTNIKYTAVPEPTTVLALGLGLGAIVLKRRRR